LGTGNVGVSAAFYHGGRVAGILSVLMEAAKGIGVVLLARYYFPNDPVWEIIALIALVMGRYWFASGSGHDQRGVGFYRPRLGDGPAHPAGERVMGFTIFRERRQGRLLVLVAVADFYRSASHSGRSFDSGGHLLSVL
jgi:hypothetical protein